MANLPLIRIQNLNKKFTHRRGMFLKNGDLWAVRDVSLDIARRETLGIVGESGCGKSTLARMLVGLLAPSSGDVLFDGNPLYDCKAHADYKGFRRGLAGMIQMVFQDPYSSLNPRMRVGESIAEPLLCSSAWRQGGTMYAANIAKRVEGILVQVGLEPAAANRYPHEFSGGQRQRIAIARALVTRPAFVVCDEPTSSLDASVQSQVLNLLRDMRNELGLTYCFISHDLSVVRHMSDRVAVMYQGLVVEEGDTETVFSSPCHPYSYLLLDSVADSFWTGGLSSAPHETAAGSIDREAFRIMDKTGDETCDAGFGAFLNSPGSVPAVSLQHSMENSVNDTCPYAPRCPERMSECEEKLPPLLTLPDKDGKERRIRCCLFKPALFDNRSILCYKHAI